MAQSESAWVHCNSCKGSVLELKCMFFFTSCGRIVCQSCCPKLKDADCPTCRGGCRTVAMNNKAPTSVMNMVKDIGGQLKGVFKIMSWQERQKRSMVEHKMMVVEKLQKEERRVSEDVARAEEQLQNRKAVLKKQEEQEAMLKAELNSMLARGVVDGGRGDGQRHRELGHQDQAWLGRPAQGLSPGGGAMSSAFYKGMAKLSPANSFLGERLDSSRRSVGSGGSRRSREDENSLRSGPSEFMQLKTPAAWYKPGPLRRGPSPR